MTSRIAPRIGAMMALVALFALIGCDSAHHLLEPGATAPMASRAGGVTTVRMNERVALNMTQFNACTGESVDFSGQVNVTSVQVWDSDGNLLHEKFHANPQGLTGIGQSSGDVYRWVGSEDNSFQTYQSGAWQVMFVGTMRLIYPGAGSNSHLMFQFFVKVDATGNFNLHIGNMSLVCR